MHNPTFIIKNGEKRIEFYPELKPNDEAMKYKYYSEGLSWHDHFMKEWQASKQSYPVKEENLEITKLVLYKWEQAQANLTKDSHAKFLEDCAKGIHIDSLKDRLELVSLCEYCGGGNNFCAQCRQEYSDNKFYFILKPVKQAVEESQDKLFAEFIDGLKPFLFSGPIDPIALANHVNKFTITRKP